MVGGLGLVRKRPGQEAVSVRELGHRLHTPVGGVEDVVQRLDEHRLLLHLRIVGEVGFSSVALSIGAPQGPDGGLPVVIFLDLWMMRTL